MADEIIKLFEYITGNPVVQGVALAYVIVSVLGALATGAVVIGTAIIIIKQFKKMR